MLQDLVKLSELLGSIRASQQELDVATPELAIDPQHALYELLV